MKRLLLLASLIAFSYLSNAQNVCSLTSFSYEIKDDGDVFYLVIEEPAHINDDYLVILNDIIIESESTRFGPFEKDCTVFYTLSIIDRTNEACGIQANIGNICNANPNCRLGEIEYKVSECNPNNVVSVSLDFVYANVSDSFYLRGNGEFYGEFAYSDLPISINPIVAGCDKEFEFVVIDSKNDSCQNYVDGIKICCDNNCNPPIFEIVSQECDSNFIYLKLELLEELTTTNLQIQVDEKLISDYEIDFPYIYIRADQKSNSLVHTVSVCTVGFADVCCHIEDFDLSDCFGNECFIGDIRYEILDCENEQEAFILIDFKYENPASDRFYVKGNGTTYGTYLYSELPIKVGPFAPGCDILYELAVIDSIDNNCVSFIEDLNICCGQNCLEPIFEIVSRECFDDNFLVKLELINPLFSDAPEVFINGEESNSYEFDFPYLYIKGESDSSFVNEITLCTISPDGFQCCYSMIFELDCGNNTDCRIGELNYSNLDCVPGEEAYILLDFKYENTTSDKFIVRGNGIEYGVFEYSELPVRIGPFDPSCNVVYELSVSDSINRECNSFIEDLSVCCNTGCDDPLFEIIDTECFNASYILKLELLNPLQSDQLLVFLNGNPIETYEIEFPYVYINSQLDSFDINQLSLCSITSSGNECCFTQEFELNCFNECRIGDLKIEASECLDTDLPGFYINFEYENVGNEGFSIKGNGRDYGDFKYDNLPIFINIEEDCNIEYEFVVIDNELACSNFGIYGTYCCSNNCSFEIDEDRVKCEDGVITEIAFFLFEETDPIKKYSVYVNGKLIGETNENNVFLEFGTEIEVDSMEYLELTVCDENCCVSKRIDISDCIDLPEECVISNVRTSEVSCGENGLNFKLNFDHEGTASDEFDVLSIFGKVGTYRYSDLPLKVEDFPSVNIGLNVLFICDKGTFCCQAHLFSSPFCLTIGGFDRVNDSVKNSNRYIKQNPVDFNLILDSPYEETKYQILDSSGQVVRQVLSDTYQTQIDVSGLSSGLYMVRIENIGEIKVEKLIITN